MGTQTSRPVGSKKDSSVSPPAPHAFAWTPELILKSIEVAALVLGGAWGLFVYTSKSQSAQRELAEFNTAHAKEPRLDVSSELTVRDLQTNADGTHTYKASFKVVLKNISKTTFDVSYAITEYYLGVLSVAHPGPNEIVQINPPHNIFYAEQPGPVQWTKIGNYASVNKSNAEKHYDISAALGRAGITSADENAGLASVLNEGESSERGREYLVRALPSQILCFVVELGVNGATEGKGVRFYRDWRYLDEASRDIPAAK